MYTEVEILDNPPFYPGDIVIGHYEETGLVDWDLNGVEVRVAYCYDVPDLKGRGYMRGISVKDGRQVHGWYAVKFKLVKGGFMRSVLEALANG